MMPLPISTVALYESAIAGQNVSVQCVPNMAKTTGRQGEVSFIDGRALPVIYLDQTICTDLENPVMLGTAEDFLVGEHEAEHIAMESLDESCVEKTALANVWQFVRLFKLPAREDNTILSNVAYDDSLWAPIYHLPCED